MHRVRITKPFLLGIHEVTVGQFRDFVEATGYRTDAETNSRGGSGWTGKGFGKQPGFTWRNWWKEQTDRHPVVNVSWNDAIQFCQWLSKKEGKTYRLPTEAEWEYACRAGTTTRFSFGDDPANMADFGNFADPRGKPPGTVLTTEVGSLKPNAWGLFDMHGNVLEWCSDWYKPIYYADSPADDPVGQKIGTTRVVRGGGWGFDPAFGRCARRGRIEPSNCGYRDGFRVACELPAKPSIAPAISPQCNTGAGTCG